MLQGNPRISAPPPLTPHLLQLRIVERELAHHLLVLLFVGHRDGAVVIQIQNISEKQRRVFAPPVHKTRLASSAGPVDVFVRKNEMAPGPGNKEEAGRPETLEAGPKEGRGPGRGRAPVGFPDQVEGVPSPSAAPALNLTCAVSVLTFKLPL